MVRERLADFPSNLRRCVILACRRHLRFGVATPPERRGASHVEVARNVPERTVGDSHIIERDIDLRALRVDLFAPPLTVASAPHLDRGRAGLIHFLILPKQPPRNDARLSGSKQVAVAQFESEYQNSRLVRHSLERAR
jgi:hypothetical protein